MNFDFSFERLEFRVRGHEFSLVFFGERGGESIGRVPHFSRSLREVGIFAAAPPTLNQRSVEFSPPRNDALSPMA